jgi:hypothetical protein
MGARGPYGGPETSWVLGPKNHWGPRTSGSLEIFGCPISPGGKTSPHFLSLLKHNCHLIAIWALLHFPRCEQETAGSQPYTTFQGPFDMRDSVLPGPPGALWDPGPHKSVTPVTPCPGHWIRARICLIPELLVVSNSLTYILKD